MEYYDNFHPTNQNDLDMTTHKLNSKDLLEEMKTDDRGYNKIYRDLPRSDGTLKRTKIEFYTSCDVGSSIRDAETGQYYSSKVGSADEDLFFKVGMSTGECKSKNGSSTLFYKSPRHYISHMRSNLNDQIISNWEDKRDYRLAEKKTAVKPSASSVIVH
jgi:hypothetical protein